MGIKGSTIHGEQRGTKGSHAHEGCRGNGKMSPHNPNIRTDGSSHTSVGPSALYKSYDGTSTATNPLTASHGRATATNGQSSSQDEMDSVIASGLGGSDTDRGDGHPKQPQPQHAGKHTTDASSGAGGDGDWLRNHPHDTAAPIVFVSDDGNTASIVSPRSGLGSAGSAGSAKRATGRAVTPTATGTASPHCQRNRSSTGAGSDGRHLSPPAAGASTGDRSDSVLSDITMSEMSATFPADTSGRSSFSLGPSAAAIGYAVHANGATITTGFLSRGDDLEQQRQQAPLSIEEDLFIYDDIVISKDEARTKHWRLAGRKPPSISLATAGATETGGTDRRGSGHRGSGGGAALAGTGQRFSCGRNFFTFNDFDVCVDEMDLAPSSTTAANAVAAYQRELAASSSSLFGDHSSVTVDGNATEPSVDGANNSATSATDITTTAAAAEPNGCGSTSDSNTSSVNAASVTAAGVNRTQQRRTLNASMSMSVINTVPTAPNTAKVYEAMRRQVAPKANRELTRFTTETILGHATRVKCIALAPDEREFASCSNEDASVALNNISVRDEVGIFTGHQDTVINVAFSPDGKYLATTSKDKTMILWDVMTTKQLLTFSHAKVVICCCFGPDSKYLVSGCQDRICRLWDTRRGKEWLTYTHHEAIIISVAFSPCGGYVCSASADKTLRVWSSTTAKTRFTLTGHVGIILSCSYTTDGKYIVSNDENLLRVWSTVDGSCTLSLTAADVAGTTHLSPKGPKLGWTLSCAAPGAFTRYIFVACNNRFVYVLDRETGKEVSSTFCKAPVYCLTSGTEELTACGDSFGNIYLLRMQ